MNITNQRLEAFALLLESISDSISRRNCSDLEPNVKHALSKDVHFIRDFNEWQDLEQYGDPVEDLDDVVDWSLLDHVAHVLRHMKRKPRWIIKHPVGSTVINDERTPNDKIASEIAGLIESDRMPEATLLIGVLGTGWSMEKVQET